MIRISTTLILGLLLTLSLHSFAKDSNSKNTTSQTKIEQNLESAVNLLGENTETLDAQQLAKKIDSLKLNQNSRINDSARNTKEL